MAKSEQASLEGSIANIISDYRAGEISKPDADHVHTWIAQFEEDVRIPILKELNHVFRKTYIPKKSVERFLAGLLKTKDLVGPDPCDFWRSANFFSGQGGGTSQWELLKVFDAALRSSCNLPVKKCGSASGPWIYLDDVICSGNRVGTDLCEWVRTEAPHDALVHVIVIAFHRYGQWSASKRIDKAIKEAKKKIKVEWWRLIELEDRAIYIDSADVLRLVSVPNTADAKKYYEAVKEASQYAPKFRKPGTNSANDIYSSEESRNILEQQLFLAGIRIRSFCDSPADIMRPLGYQGFASFGFGALIATFRNCANNCPLALWWGDPNHPESHPLGRWYPLLPRKTHDQSFEYYFGNSRDD